MLSFSFFWAQDFCKKSVLARRFFFRVSVFGFVTITRHTLFYESIMVTVFSYIKWFVARVIVTKPAEKARAGGGRRRRLKTHKHNNNNEKYINTIMDSILKPHFDGP